LIVLDTHALIWWVSSPDKLPARARRLVDAEAEDKGLAASSISIWELAMLTQRGRLALTVPLDVWIASVEAMPFLRFVPIDNGIAARAVLLDLPHKDPADRMILATALGLGATLVTADTRLRSYRSVKSVWG